MFLSFPWVEYLIFIEDVCIEIIILLHLLCLKPYSWYKDSVMLRCYYTFIYLFHCFCCHRASWLRGPERSQLEDSLNEIYMYVFIAHWYLHKLTLSKQCISMSLFKLVINQTSVNGLWVLISVLTLTHVVVYTLGSSMLSWSQTGHV